MKAVRTIELEKEQKEKGPIMDCVQRRLKDIEVFLADSGVRLEEAWRNEGEVSITMKIKVVPSESANQYDTAWDVKFPLDRVHAGGKVKVTPNQQDLPLR